MNVIAIMYTVLTRWSVRFVGAASLLAATIGGAQGATPLAITSPGNGTVVMSGQALPVTVIVRSGTYPSGMVVIAQNPLGAAGPVTGSPATFYLTPPANTPPGTYSITAVAANASGVIVTSASVTVDVERVDTAAAISVQPMTANLRFVGDTLPLSVTGTFTGGMLVDMTQSSKLTITSENPNVATVQNGLITATGAGQTHIDVQYGPNLVKVAVTVPTSIRGDLDGDGSVDKDDLNIILAALNTRATGPHDARDLNHDGVINALDARILVTLCTKPGCATH